MSAWQSDPIFEQKSGREHQRFRHKDRHTLPFKWEILPLIQLFSIVKTLHSGNDQAFSGQNHSVFGSNGTTDWAEFRDRNFNIQFTVPISGGLTKLGGGQDWRSEGVDLGAKHYRKYYGAHRIFVKMTTKAKKPKWPPKKTKDAQYIFFLLQRKFSRFPLTFDKANRTFFRLEECLIHKGQSKHKWMKLGEFGRLRSNPFWLPKLC